MPARDAADVTLLRISEDYTITSLIPAGKEPNRIEAGGRRSVKLEVIKGELPTLERLIALAAPARKGAPKADFTWATQPSGRPDKSAKLDPSGCAAPAGSPRPRIGKPAQRRARLRGRVCGGTDQTSRAP